MVGVAPPCIAVPAATSSKAGKLSQSPFNAFGARHSKHLVPPVLLTIFFDMRWVKTPMCISGQAARENVIPME